MLRCQICQHENPEGAEYCENCGSALESGTVSAPRAEPATTPDATDDPGTAQSAPESMSDELDATPDPDAEISASDAEAPASEPIPAPRPASDQRPRLTPIRHGAPVGDAYPLLGDRLLVGRFDAETGPVDIDLSNVPEAEQISRHHAEIYRESDGTWYIRDLGSTNGVFVKQAGNTRFGPRLTAPQELSSGDELSFGNVSFRFQIG